MEWNKNSLDAAATILYGELQTYDPDKLRSALNEALKMQGCVTLDKGYTAFYDYSYKAGREDAIKEMTEYMSALARARSKGGD